jgi:predicted MFS family arabinose efflux permease
MTLGIGVFGARFDRRALLILASVLMVATGLAFATSRSYAVLVLIAFVGTINPSAGSVSVFVPLEHALLAGAVADADRTRSFARYSLIGAFAAALGSLAAASPEFLGAAGLSRLAAIRLMFLLYALLGVAGGLLYLRVPRQARPVGQQLPATLGPSKRVVYRLAALFSIDAFAGGFAVQSLMALWLFHKFGLSLVAAGTFFFWAGLLSGLSFLAAARLSNRFGLINTMVFTHIPASLCLMLAAVVPSLPLALGLLLVRSALSQMDVPTRSSYVMGVVTPAERAAAASVTSVPRTLAAAASPSIAGALFAAGYEAWPFLLCGALKMLYDVLLLWTFRHVRPPEERS